MMAVTNIYADVDDVQALINMLGSPTTLTIGAGTVPTTTQVEGWLDQVAADIDGVLSDLGYDEVESGDTKDVLRIKRYVAQKVAAIVFHAGFMFDELPDKVGAWSEEYDTFIQRLISKETGLISQTSRRSPGVVLPQRYRED